MDDIIVCSYNNNKGSVHWVQIQVFKKKILFLIFFEKNV